MPASGDQPRFCQFLTDSPAKTPVILPRTTAKLIIQHISRFRDSHSRNTLAPGQIPVMRNVLIVLADHKDALAELSSACNEVYRPGQSPTGLLALGAASDSLAERPNPTRCCAALLRGSQLPALPYTPQPIPWFEL
jgi:hypothetical protein